MVPAIHIVIVMEYTVQGLLKVRNTTSSSDCLLSFPNLSLDLDPAKSPNQSLVHVKDGRADCALEKVRKEVTAKEAEIQRLKEECAELKERKQKLWQQVQRNSVYVDYMQEVLNMTKVLQGFQHGNEYFFFFLNVLNRVHHDSLDMWLCINTNVYATV